MRTLWNEVFKPDSGIVFEIRAYGITAKDYDVLLPLLIRRYPAVYSEDGETRDLPDYSTITHRRNLVTTALELNIVCVRVRCWFSELDQIDLDLLPAIEGAQPAFQVVRAGYRRRQHRDRRGLPGNRHDEPGGRAAGGRKSATAARTTAPRGAPPCPPPRFPAGSNRRRSARS